MKIDLKNLMRAKVESIPFEGTLDLSAESFHGEYPFQSPVTYAGTITNHSDVLRLEGSIATTYHTPCARCLTPLQVPVQAQANVVLLPDDGTHEEEEDIALYKGDCIDPEEVLLPELLLHLSMVYLCKEDCRGLCRHCGINRNLSQCDCDEKQIDDRLAVLQTLLDSKQKH